MNVLLLGYDSTIFKDAPTASDTQTRMADYARRLDELVPGSTVTVISHTLRREAKAQQTTENLWFIPAYAPNPHLFPLSGWLQATRLLQHRQPDVISSQSPFEDALLGLLLSKRYKAKFEVQTHFGIASPYWVKEHAVINRLRIRLAQFCYRRADKVRVPSSWLRREISERLGIEGKKIRVVIIPSSLASSDFEPQARSVSEQYRFPGDHQQYVLYIGSLIWQKNIPFLVDIMREICTQRPRVGFVIAGDGPEREWLKGEVKRHQLGDQVHALGKVPHRHVGNLFRQANALILPSYYEGLARVQLEAYAAGVPCISTRVSGTDDVILDGETGFIVEVNDLPAFVDRLIWLLDRPSEAKEMGLKGKQYVLKKYAYGQVVDELVQGWVELANRE
jgi:glycosyltransferase involved in cell wall biosynthesis